tara:strand:+ start:2369 stop:3091 length:723 start_codon:yes stop_codon:yes gene_type:complete
MVVENSIIKIPKNFLQNFAQLDNGAEWVKYSVSGNGSCFYNSAAAALNYNNYIKHSVKSQEAIGRNLRRQFQREINENSWSEFWKHHNLQHVAPNYLKARQEVADPKTWANLWTIYVFSCWTRTNFIFYDMDNECLPYCGITTVDPEKCPQRPKNCMLPDSKWNLVTIAWVNKSHFDPIMVFKNYCKSCQMPTHRSQLVRKNHNLVLNFKKNEKLYKDILKKYNQGKCSGKTIQHAALKN